jgi:hypothetical protein
MKETGFFPVFFPVFLFTFTLFPTTDTIPDNPAHSRYSGRIFDSFPAFSLVPYGLTFVTFLSEHLHLSENDFPSQSGQLGDVRQDSFEYQLKSSD